MMASTQVIATNTAFANAPGVVGWAPWHCEQSAAGNRIKIDRAGAARPCLHSGRRPSRREWDRMRRMPGDRQGTRRYAPVSFPKIISGRNGGAARTRLGWRQSHRG